MFVSNFIYTEAPSRKLLGIFRKDFISVFDSLAYPDMALDQMLSKYLITKARWPYYMDLKKVLNKYTVIC